MNKISNPKIIELLLKNQSKPLILLNQNQVNYITEKASNLLEDYNIDTKELIVNIKQKLGIVNFTELVEEKSVQLDTFQLSIHLFPDNDNTYLLINKPIEEENTAIKATEEVFRTLLDNAPDAITLLNAETGKFEIVNENAVKLFKMNRAELLTKTPDEMSPKFQPDGRSSKVAARDYIVQAINDNPPVFNWVHRDSEGNDILCEIRLIKLVLNGKLMVRGSIIDITEREKSKQLLRQRDYQYRELIESAPIGIAIVQDMTIKLLNTELVKMLGYQTKSELIDKNAKLILSQDSGDKIERIHRARVDRKTVPDQYRTVVKNKNGEEFWVKVNATRILYRNQPASLVFMEDIDQQVEQEENYNLMQKQLQQNMKMESLGVIASGIAHDFNNFLFGIIGKADILKSGYNLDDDTLSIVNEIIEYSTQAKNLIKQILLYGGKGSEKTEIIDINELIDKTKPFIETTIPERIIVEYDLDEVNTIRGNKDQIRQILVNILVNAVDVIEGSGNISIRTNTQTLNSDDILRLVYSSDFKPGRYVCLEIEDSGDGIPEKNIEQIFDLFYSTKSSSRGLGLATVLGSIKKHKGAIKVESEIGVGTKFSIYFRPSIINHIEDDQVVKIEKDERELNFSGKILVCDDKKIVRNTISQMLELIGIETTTVSSGVKAISLLEIDHDFDLLILDLSMPEMDGVETLKRIREFDKSIPVVISTGYEIEGVKKKINSIENTGFLKKPYDFDELRVILNTYL